MTRFRMLQKLATKRRLSEVHLVLELASLTRFSGYEDPDFLFLILVLSQLIGWVISATAGALPLLGFSDYSLVAICLPFQVLLLLASVSGPFTC